MKKLPSTKKLVVFLLIVLTLAVSACGGPRSSNKISFTMTDFAFTPNEFTVTSGEEITLNVKHHGTMEHNFIVMKYGTDAGEMFDEEDKVNVFWEIDVQPGDARTAVFKAPEEPGTYQIICGMVGHLQSGMVGKLVVVEAPK
jgi:uncharacterized cupredoxin-like copper-binding protein